VIICLAMRIADRSQQVNHLRNASRHLTAPTGYPAASMTGLG
jgi:hypothetical protein